MEGSVVEVVVVVTTVVTGVGANGNVAGAVDTGCGRVAGGAVGGEVGRVVRGTVGRNAVVGGGTVAEGSVVRGTEVAVWGAVVSIEEVAVVRRLSNDTEAWDEVGRGPTMTAATRNAAVRPSATLIAMTKRRGTASVWLVAGGQREHSSQVRSGRDGRAGITTRSPGKSRFGSAGFGRNGRFTCTTSHQYRARTRSGGIWPQASVRVAAAIDQRSSPGRTVHHVTGLGPGRERVDPLDGAEEADGGPGVGRRCQPRVGLGCGHRSVRARARREILRLVGVDPPALMSGCRLGWRGRGRRCRRRRDRSDRCGGGGMVAAGAQRGAARRPVAFQFGLAGWPGAAAGRGHRRSAVRAGRLAWRRRHWRRHRHTAVPAQRLRPVLFPTGS